MSVQEYRAVPRQNPKIVRDLEAGLACHQRGQRDRAEQLYRKVLRRDPNQPDALRLLGVIACERGRHEYAVQLLSRALALRPGFAEAHQDLGNVLRALGRLDEAAENYRAAIVSKPDFAQAHCNLAAILIERGAHEAALEHATRAAELLPELAEAHHNRGTALSGRRRFAEAEAAYRRALVLQPQNADALSNLGYVLSEMKQIDEGLACHREALARQPDNPLFHLRLSTTQLRGDDPEASEASCRRALSLDPSLARAWNWLGQVLRCLGRFEESRSCLRQAVELDPELPNAYAGLAALGERAENDGKEKFRRLQALLADPERPAMAHIDAGFALGMLLDNAGRYDEAFPCFSQANSLYRRLLAEAGEGYDQAAFRRQIDGLIEACTSELYASVEDEGSPSDMPVFVVGMPRSGTSLVEQIAASHSRVAGAGELQDISRIVGKVQAHGQELVEEEMDPDVARRLADGYIDHLRRIGRGAERVIDKMPDNILGLGVAALLFPQARIVFCRRDPRDTCLSCYFHRFDQPIPWAYDLADCGLRALEMERLAEHWRRVLPLRMLTIDYEALVADLEGESRRLIEFLGLDWEPACLDFHKTERPVLTASGWQVRQPLYTRSVGRWRHYERHLRPLLEALASGAESGRPAQV
jgi:tetratricopeptide (TPR) repeat protein